MRRRKIAAGILTAVMTLGSIGIPALGEENVDGQAELNVETPAEAPTEALTETEAAAEGTAAQDEGETSLGEPGGGDW